MYLLMPFVFLNRRVSGFDKGVVANNGGSISFTVPTYVGSDGGERQKVSRWPVCCLRFETRTLQVRNRVPVIAPEDV